MKIIIEIVFLIFIKIVIILLLIIVSTINNDSYTPSINNNININNLLSIDYDSNKKISLLFI